MQADSKKRSKIDEFEKFFSNYLLKNEIKISLFDFRETFERYVGLTFSLSESDEGIPVENEFFRIVQHKNVKLGQICLQRRNRLRLLTHQNIAREDLLKIFAGMHSGVVDSKKLEFSAVEFFKLIEDLEAGNLLDEIFSSTIANRKDFPRPGIGE